MQELINNLVQAMAQETNALAEIQLKIVEVSQIDYEELKTSTLNELYKAVEFFEEMIATKKQIVQRLIDLKEGKIK